MNYEEKYKEALENLQKIKESNKDNNELVEFIECKFPELKESKAEWVEKIRKELKGYLGKRPLKKLSESDAVNQWIDWIEKQGEKKPTWSEDDERIRKEIMDFVVGNTISKDGRREIYLAWHEKQGEPQDKGEISDGYHTFNELYYYRMLYNAAFFNMLPKEWVHKSKRHNDGEECFGGGWFIVMANLPTGQISNHYELKDWDLFQIPEKEVADKWDGHTPQEAADRLHKYILEKQGEQEKLYIRFGEIPTDEKSKIYNGEIEVGTENGVSVYHAFKTHEGDIVLGLSLPITKTTLYTQQHLIEYSDRPCYLVKGDYVGKDTDGQPLINNVSIIKKIGTYRVKEEKQVEQKESLCDKCKKAQPSHSCQDITALGRCYIEGMNTSNKVEPKFHEGDWISNGVAIWHIEDVNGKEYILSGRSGVIKQASILFIDSKFHLWTIQDAKEGDVLICGNQTLLFKCIEEKQVYCYGYIWRNEYKNLIGFQFLNQPNQLYCYTDAVMSPATKKQRDTLFANMKEAGYSWDADKKELKKIEQKSTNIEPKFKICDWIVHDMSDGRKVIRQIIGMTNKSYILDCEDFNTFYFNDLENDYHLWTIEDAEDGDVICYKDEISLYKHDIKNCTKQETTFGGFVYYCCYDGKRFVIDSLYSLTEQDKMDIHPSTKEQRDILFQKMKESGYEWDADKKELKKIEPKHTWSEEDEKILNEFIESLRYCNGNGYNKQIDWLKSLKDRI